MIPPLPPAWEPLLAPATRHPSFKSLARFLDEELRRGQQVLPQSHEILRALELTPPARVRVVLVGQDPYPTPGHAHGLCFSVRRDVRPIPGSLRNIYKELGTDLGLPRPDHGCLESWAHQGVLLLNTVLTVPAGSAGGHRGKGWEAFTDAILQAVARLPRRVVFLLWGNDARRKLPLIPTEPHRVVATAHPSPLSARHFLGCRCFSAVNLHLTEAGIDPVDWSVPGLSENGQDEPHVVHSPVRSQLLTR